MKRVLVVGYDGGLGKEVCGVLANGNTVVRGAFDIRNERDIKDFFTNCIPFSAVVYCAGVNYIREFDDIKYGEFFESIDVNCFGFVRLILLMRKLDKFHKRAQACIVTSNAAQIPMSHSLSYNCSKAAANMMVRQMGRELDVQELTVFGVAPNKLAGTGMSKAIEDKVCEMRGWSPEIARSYQLAALPAGKETSPQACAHFIRQLLEFPHDFTLHGTVLPYGGPV